MAGLRQNPEDTAIVQGVLRLGHGLGMKVVAEDVETPEQLEALWALGCDIGQKGYSASLPRRLYP